MMVKLINILSLLMVSNMVVAQGEGDTTPTKIKVNLDCSFCDQDYIRQQINYVDYVRDQGNADLYLFFVRNSNGSGGRSYDISFFGKNEYEESFFKLSFSTGKLDTPDEIRKIITQNIIAGLVPFLYNKPGISVNVFREYDSEAEFSDVPQVKDRWNNWVLEIYASGEYSLESQQKEIEYEYGLEVDRITAKYRINQDLYTETNKKIIQDATVITISRSRYSGRFIKSLNDHWSAGIFTTLESNSYRNIDLLSSSELAIEYNIFPWPLVSKKQFTFNYRLGYLYQNYVEETIFNKNEDLVPIHSLGAEILLNQPWGSIDSSLELSQFVNNFDRRRIEFEFNIRVRLLKGLSARFSGEYNVVQDQINLVKGEASVEDIISRRREIATNFSAEFNIGLSYTFGSMFNNVVNQRL